MTRAGGAHSEDVLETVFQGVRWLRDGVKWVEVERRVDGLGDADGDGAEVHLRERQRETWREILRGIRGRTIYDKG
jgi:hypothetical protein